MFTGHGGRSAQQGDKQGGKMHEIYETGEEIECHAECRIGI
jgi:hypothetical protein